VKRKPSDASSKPRRTRFRRFVTSFLLVCGIYIGFCAGIAWNTVRPKNSKLEATPALYNVPFEKVSFTSSDGTRLAGWFLPSSRKSPRGVIVLCHGVDSTRTAMLWKASILHKHGYAALLFDFRGRGESAPSLCTIGYREVDDLLAAIKYTRGRKELRDVPLGVLGESQGGAVALMGTARSEDVKAVVAESAFAQLDHAVSNHFRSLLGGAGVIALTPVRWIGERLICRQCCDVSPVSEISRISPRPLLLIQDGADALCPPEETKALMAAAKEPKELWTVPSADHINAERVAPKEFEARVIQFFDKAFEL
jgi:fermentation-respiration switch protein FrsA (DUF1100 family)